MNYLKQAREFGRALITTGDLDPVYIAIAGAKLPWNQRARLVLAYACLYHLGCAAYLSEFKGDEFWEKLRLAADNVHGPVEGKWPRGTERRHWRGKAAADSWSCLTLGDTPEAVIEYWFDECPNAFQYCYRRILETTGFGPWVGFKLVDMAERVLGYDINMRECGKYFYKEPLAGAALIHKNLAAAIELLHDALGELPAPAGGRRCGIMEMETVLCKFKAHVKGHYTVGKDIREVRHALQQVDCATARRLLKAMPLSSVKDVEERINRSVEQQFNLPQQKWVTAR